MKKKNKKKKTTAYVDIFCYLFLSGFYKTNVLRSKIKIKFSLKNSITRMSWQSSSWIFLKYELKITTKSQEILHKIYQLKGKYLCHFIKTFLISKYYKANIF